MPRSIDGPHVAFRTPESPRVPTWESQGPRVLRRNVVLVSVPSLLDPDFAPKAGAFLVPLVLVFPFRSSRT